MEPLTLKTASRFNRITPLFMNDPMVTKAINELAEKPAVKSEAKKLEAAVNNLSEIKYVNLELQKRYGFTNNLKLMMANNTIFNALLNSCLKSGTLDLEDFDYINVNLREAAKEYNKMLISSYASFVLIEKGKTYKDEVQDLATLVKKLGDLKNDFDVLQKSEEKLKIDLQSANETIDKLKELLEASRQNEKTLSDQIDFLKGSEYEYKMRLEGVDRFWQELIEIVDSEKESPFQKRLKAFISEKIKHAQTNDTSK